MDEQRKPVSISADGILKCKLLVTEVDHRKEEFFLDFLQTFGVNLQLSMRGEGTAKTETLRLLGLTESEKAIIFSVIREDRIGAACAALQEKFAKVKNGRGIAFTIPLSSVMGSSVYRFLSDQKVQGGN